MDLVALWTAVKARADADNAAAGIGSAASGRIITGIFNTAVPVGTDRPFIVYNVASCNQIHTFATEGWEVIIRMSIYVSRNMANGMSKLAAIEARVYGDTAAGSAPSYGFQRWKPTLSGSWVADSMVVEDMIINDDDEGYQHIMQFKLLVSK